MIKMKIKNKITIIIILISSLLFSNNNAIKKTNNKKQILRQASSLQKNGLTSEAYQMYYDLFLDFPDSYEAYEPLKKILVNENNLKELDKITSQYLDSNNNSIATMVQVFDVLMILDEKNKIDFIFNNLINQFPKNKNSIKKVLKKLLNQNKINDAINIINQIRIKENDFFALELGMHYSITMEIEKSLEQFLLYLNNNPKQKDFVFNRVLALPDIDFVVEKIKAYLIENDNQNAKLLLSKIEFKQKNYIIAYDLISEYKEEEYYIKFVEDLIRVEEFELAEKVIQDIFNNNFSAQNLEKTIFLLAQLFEDMLISQDNQLYLVNNIKNNDLLDSPFKKIDENKSILLDKAINIYDSLRINTKQIKPLYHLAEINYKILGDLDGANKLYNQILTKGYNQYYLLSIEKNIDIMISKGELEKALEYINNQINANTKQEIKNILKIKETQILFYLHDIDKLNEKITEILKVIDKNNPYYNDILKIKYDVLLLSDNIHFKKYTTAMHKVFQNKRIEAINILNSIYNSDDNLINNKIKLDCAYLNFEQGNFIKSIELLELIDLDYPYNEEATIFKAEIYDYVLNNKSKAAEIYLSFLDNYQTSIYYESVRFRLRQLAG
tara:strand:- start:1041 stop:2876 length:1836 start_codon:yes stop_codon:yes gene_type:complete